MVHASNVRASIAITAIPVLDGAIELFRSGQQSTLQPQNEKARKEIESETQYANDPRYSVLFDPQTAGGLLASVPHGNVDVCLAALRDSGYVQAAIVGEVMPLKPGAAPILLCSG
jgi:selenide,water dikinase